jgi:hypothetical protein
MTYLLFEGHSNADGSFTIPAHLMTRWKRQMNTEYVDLPETEKETDRQIAERIIHEVRNVSV